MGATLAGELTRLQTLTECPGATARISRMSDHNRPADKGRRMLAGDARYVLSLRRTGLGDRLVCLAAACKYARDTKRTLVIDWRNSIYGRKSHGLFGFRRPDHENLFLSCFEPLSSIGSVPIVAADDFDTGALPRPVFPKVWEYGALMSRPWSAPPGGFPGDKERAVEIIRSGEDRPERTVVFNDCVNDGIVLAEEARAILSALRPAAGIAKQVASFADQNRFADGVIGVHVRNGNGGDIMGHARFWTSFAPAIDRVVRAIAAARDRLGFEAPAFLCTDSSDVQSALSARVAKLLVRPKAFRRPGRGELHVGRGAARGVGDALIEMALLARCQVLIRYPPGSFFSFYAAVMKAHADEDRSTTLYDLQQPWDASDPLAPAILY
jgi:hypothetical protein